MSLTTLINKFEQLQKGIKHEVAAAFGEVSQQWVYLNLGQMYKGVNSLGQPIGMYKSGIYAEVKHRMNPTPGEGIPDLFVTGAFYRGEYVRIEGNKILSGSDDSKNDKLEKRYGKVIHGLNAESKNEFISTELIPAVRRRIGL